MSTLEAEVVAECAGVSYEMMVQDLKPRFPLLFHILESLSPEMNIVPRISKEPRRIGKSILSDLSIEMLQE